MERYEIRVKYDEINRLVEQKRYEEARRIANTIDWDRTKNVNMLCVAGEVFERCGDYEAAKATYLRAYQFQPKSRIIVYRLAELSIKLRDYNESIHYYKNYEEIAPGDANLYVLRYKIYKARGAATEVLIRILQELKEVDYHERWAYELAKLYAEAGLIDMSVAECDEIHLWFGNGKYVCKALQLKKRYKPLTYEQQKKLDDYQAARQPRSAERTIAEGDEARRSQMEKTEEFVKLREQARQEETAERISPAEDASRRRARENMNQAREAAINAARRAKAAQLLQEAAEEAKREESKAEEEDNERFLQKDPEPDYGETSAESIPVRQKPQFMMPGVEVKAPEEEIKLVGGKIETPEEDIRPAGRKKEAPEEESRPDITQKEASEEKDRSAITEWKEELESLGDDRQDISDELFEDAPSWEEPQMKQPSKMMRPEDISAENGASEGDLLAQRIALALQGRMSAQPAKTNEYEDDFIYVNKDEDSYIDEKLTEKEAFVGTLSEKEMDSVDDLEFTDDYEDDDSEEDERIFRKKESAFWKSWRKNSSSKPQKGVTRISNMPEYDIQIKPVVVNRYDTINLQKELAKSIRAIMDAKEQKEVEQTIRDMGRSMEESNIPRLIRTKRLNVNAVKASLEKEEQKSTRMEARKLESFLSDILDEEYDGQIRLLMEEEKPDDQQIEGQISIQELLEEREKEALEEAKRKALEQAGEYMEQLSVVVPFMADNDLVELDEESAEDLIAATQENAAENEDDDMTKAEMKQLYQDAQELAGSDAPSREEVTRMIAKLSNMLVEMQLEEDRKTITDAAAEDAQADLETAENPAEEDVQADLETTENPADEDAGDADDFITETVKSRKKPEKHKISEEQKDVMAYFMKVGGVEKQIVDYLERGEDHKENLIITGVKGSGKTSLALRLVKAIARPEDPASRRIAKIPAASMNDKPLKAVFEKVQNGTLIIEDAGGLSATACEHLQPLMNAYAGALRVILVGEKEPVEQMLQEIPSLAEKFAFQFDLPMYSSDELVEFGKNYAYTKGFVIDELAVLALYSKIAEERSRNQAVMLGDMKRILNAAMEHCGEKRGKKLFGGLFSKNVDDEGNIILKEEDFELDLS